MAEKTGKLKPGVYTAEVSRKFVARPSGPDIPDHLKQLSAFLLEFNDESERGAALLAASMLDEQLKAILEAFLIEGKHQDKLLKDFNPPLGTLSSRLEACAAMGLVSEQEYAEIDVIRRVRNEFGHGLGVTFDTKKVSALCAKLTMSVGNVAKAGEPPVGPKPRFVTAAVSVIVLLTNRAHYVAKKRLESQSWPT